MLINICISNRHTINEGGYFFLNINCLPASCFNIIYLIHPGAWIAGWQVLKKPACSDVLDPSAQVNSSTFHVCYVCYYSRVFGDRSPVAIPFNTMQWHKMPILSALSWARYPGYVKCWATSSLWLRPLWRLLCVLSSRLIMIKLCSYAKILLKLGQNSHFSFSIL